MKCNYINEGDGFIGLVVEEIRSFRMIIKVFMINKSFMIKQIKGLGSKRCILTTTFRSWDSKEESVGFSPENR